jgi:hypothetical protein
MEFSPGMSQRLEASRLTLADVREDREAQQKQVNDQLVELRQYLPVLARDARNIGSLALQHNLHQPDRLIGKTPWTTLAKGWFITAQMQSAMLRMRKGVKAGRVKVVTMLDPNKGLFVAQQGPMNVGHIPSRTTLVEDLPIRIYGTEQVVVDGANLRPNPQLISPTTPDEILSILDFEVVQDGLANFAARHDLYLSQ